jgi:hypothetical protein
MFEKLQEIINSWLPKAKAKIQESASEIEAKLMNYEQIPVAESLRESLVDQIRYLPTNPIYQKLVKENLSTALEKWSKKSWFTNHLVITGFPVENLENICEDSLQGFDLDNVHLLESIPMAYDEDILINYLTDIINKIKDNEDSQIVIIPNLSNFFLRSVNGLDLIQFLLVTIRENPEHFWLIGCSNWLWTYLNHVCKIEVYLDNKICLPLLQAHDLKLWLEPIFSNFKLQWLFPENGMTRPENLEKVWENEAQHKFFQNLAKLSLGSQAIAGDLWLNSLSIMKLEIPQEETPKTVENEEETEVKTKDVIVAKLPLVPNFFMLEQRDRFLLVAVGLHEKISLANLAFILGEDILNIKSQVFNLIKFKLINFEHNLISLNPLFYPKLIKDLQENHLLTDLEEG